MVIAYLRVGTSNKELLEEQKDEIERYASNHDMNVDKWITDVTVDKGREDERNLARVLDRMQKGDSLIFSDISRLGRTLSKVMDIMGRCMEKGVQIYSIRDRYILDQALDLPVMGNVFKLVTEIEHSLMSIRTKEALNHKKSTGGPLGRPKGSAAKQFSKFVNVLMFPEIPIICSNGTTDSKTNPFSACIARSRLLSVA